MLQQRVVIGIASADRVTGYRDNFCGVGRLVGKRTRGDTIQGHLVTAQRDDACAAAQGCGSRGVVTEQLQSLYFDYVHGRRDDHAEWLTYVN